MTLDEFIEFLETHGVSHHTTTGSIIISECPSCGSSKDKIWLYKDRPHENGPFFGKCMKCDEKWNSRSLLLALGIDSGEVRALHGIYEDFNLSIMPVIDLFGTKAEKVIEAPETPHCDVSMFLPVDAVSKCEAAQYAVRRGFTPVQNNDVLIDYYTQSVVFVVRDGDKIVGYQRRFVHPIDPKMKTMSSPGFQKRNFVMSFPNDGDICVCEGPFTALSAWHFGYYGICTFGSNVGERQIDVISNIAAKAGKSVAVAFDNDKSGRKGFARVSSALKWRNIQAYRIRPETGNDLNDSWLAKTGVKVITTEMEDFSIPDLDILGEES